MTDVLLAYFAGLLTLPLIAGAYFFIGGVVSIVRHIRVHGPIE